MKELHTFVRLNKLKLLNKLGLLFIMLFLLFIPLITPLAFGESAFWKPTALKANFDRSSVGFCQKDTSCIVHKDNNASLDGDISAFFKGSLPSEKPRCLNNEQYVLDFYCDNSNWASRTKFIALQLLDLAEEKSLNDFVLFCDNKDNTLNNINYLIDNNRVSQLVSGTCNPFGSLQQQQCVNNFCVLKYGTKTAFGTSLNTDIKGSTSFLKVFELSTSACDNAINSDSFVECNQNPQGAKLFYNGKLQSIVYVPIDTITSFSLATLFNNYFLIPFKKIINYTQDTKPNDVRLQQLLNGTGIYNILYLTKKNQHIRIR